MSRIQDGHQYKGYTYAPWEDREPDNIKIFHDVVCPDGRTVSMDWSPYSTPSAEMFALWIDLGMPKRITCGPLNEKDILSLRQKAC